MKSQTSFLAIAAVVLMASSAFGQCASCGSSGGVAYSGGNQLGGGVSHDMTMPVCPPTRTGYPRPSQTLRYAVRDHYSPHPVYAYSRAGIDAQRTDEWNKLQGQATPWHGNYSYWRYAAPTALVVPPTAAFQSEYNWGVGQTRSMPINHQFGYGDAGMIGGAGGGAFYPTPYWPSSTNQFGVYPVRGPWH
jgi:hypothetical protein